MEDCDSTVYETPTSTPRNCTGDSFPSGSLLVLGEYSGFGSDDPSDDGSPVDCPFSKPFVVVDVVWNLGFVLASLFVLLCTFTEKPSTPLRVWIMGNAFQCILHVGFVYYEHLRLFHDRRTHTRILKKLESANTIASSFWWVVGFYWIVVGGQSLLQDSPCLYWFTVVFLALDVFFMIFWIGVACVVCLALFCCIPVVAIAYAMTIRKGAPEDEIKKLPTFRFRPSCASTTSSSTQLGSGNVISEPSLQLEDSECCICLTAYNEGAQLCSLPCNHHFHHGCISKWLRINATCPLCKFNILGKGDTLV